MALDRLPLTRAALAAGQIDERRAAVIADELSGLDDEHAAAVEAAIMGGAPGQTTSELRAAARRAVIAADPAAAKRRKDKALKDARVEAFTEPAGTAGLSGRDLPPAAVLAADKNLTALADAMKKAGAEGTMDQLRARAYLQLLSGQTTATLFARISASTGTATPGTANPGTGTPGTATAGSGTAAGAPGEENAGGGAWGAGPVGTGTAGSGAPGVGLPALRGSVNLTMPLAAWLGWSQSPGHVPGFGPLDAEDSRDIAARLARNPASQWCITLTDPAGHPVAHGCAKPGPGPSPSQTPAPEPHPAPEPAPARPPAPMIPAGGPAAIPAGAHPVAAILAEAHPAPALAIPATAARPVKAVPVKAAPAGTAPAAAAPPGSYPALTLSTTPAPVPPATPDGSAGSRSLPCKHATAPTRERPGRIRSAPHCAASSRYARTPAPGPAAAAPPPGASSDAS